jgi:hypothetical protein
MQAPTYFTKPGVSRDFKASRQGLAADMSHVPAAAAYHAILENALLQRRESPAITTGFRNDCQVGE